MNKFNERGQSFEKKFAKDQELQFKVAARGAVPNPIPMPIPIAYSKDCIDSSPAAVDSVLDTI